MEHCRIYYELPVSDRPDYLLKHLSDITRFMPQYIQEQELTLYYYLVTFTLRSDTVSLADEAEAYIVKQFERAPLKIVEAHYVRELTKKGVPHWHVAVSTSIPLKKDRFNYYMKLYGNIDISKTKAQTLTESMNYISKISLPRAIKGVSRLDPNPPTKLAQQGTKPTLQFFLDSDSESNGT